jgi:Ca2+-binding RTX toxin-like protein
VTQTYTVNVSGANDAPVISSPNSGNAVALNVAENTANTVVVVDVNATDVDIENISYSLTGDDALLFNINSATGEVTFKNAPDFETPLDSGGNNIYNFTVVASDGSASDTQNVAITVTDVPESTGPTIAPVYNGTGDPNDFDSLVGTASSGFLLVNGTIAGETITGDTSTNDKDIINALGGDDTVYAGDATDTVYGGDGVDTIYGGDQNDSLYGQAGNDTINGDANNDAIYGGSGNDILNGNANGDNIFGGSGNDTLNGGDGNDSLTGGYGADNLTGGSGADTFMFVSALDIGDVISDFIAADDTLDFSGIDANSTTGANDAFIAATNSSTVVANSINYFQSGSDTIVWADTDGDTSTVEFQVTLSNVTASLLTNNDFTL